MKVPYTVISLRNYSRIDFDKAVEDLNNIDWTRMMDINSADDILRFFETEVTKILNSHAPLIKRRVKGKKSPWMTKEILALMWERDKKRNEYNKNRTDNLEREFKI